jgi:transposase-like protein
MLRLYNFARVYVDNVIIYSSSLKKHLRYLNEIFSLFKRINIVIKSSKIFLNYSIIAFLN